MHTRSAMRDAWCGTVAEGAFPGGAWNEVNISQAGAAMKPGRTLGGLRSRMALRVCARGLPID